MHTRSNQSGCNRIKGGLRTAPTPTTPCRSLCQFQWVVGQQLGAGFGNEEGVLQADSPAQLVGIGAWLDADDVAGLQDSLSVAIKIGQFVSTQPGRVPGVVDQARLPQVRMF